MCPELSRGSEAEEGGSVPIPAEVRNLQSISLLSSSGTQGPASLSGGH